MIDFLNYATMLAENKGDPSKIMIKIFDNKYKEIIKEKKQDISNNINVNKIEDNTILNKNTGPTTPDRSGQSYLDYIQKELTIDDYYNRNGCLSDSDEECIKINKIKQELVSHSIKYKIYIVRGDGNCGFHSILYPIFLHFLKNRNLIDALIIRCKKEYNDSINKAYPDVLINKNLKIDDPNLNHPIIFVLNKIKDIKYTKTDLYDLLRKWVKNNKLDNSNTRGRSELINSTTNIEQNISLKCILYLRKYIARLEYNNGGNAQECWNALNEGYSIEPHLLLNIRNYFNIPLGVIKFDRESKHLIDVYTLNVIKSIEYDNINNAISSCNIFALYKSGHYDMFFVE